MAVAAPRVAMTRVATNARAGLRAPVDSGAARVGDTAAASPVADSRAETVTEPPVGPGTPSSTETDHELAPATMLAGVGRAAVRGTRIGGQTRAIGAGTPGMAIPASPIGETVIPGVAMVARETDRAIVVVRATAMSAVRIATVVTVAAAALMTEAAGVTHPSERANADSITDPAARPRVDVRVAAVLGVPMAIGDLRVAIANGAVTATEVAGATTVTGGQRIAAPAARIAVRDRATAHGARVMTAARAIAQGRRAVAVRVAMDGAMMANVSRAATGGSIAIRRPVGGPATTTGAVVSAAIGGALAMASVDPTLAAAIRVAAVAARSTGAAMTTRSRATATRRSPRVSTEGISTPRRGPSSAG